MLPRVRAGFLPGYYGTLLSDASKKRYSDKLKLMDGIDPYEVAKNEWKDDVDLWPAVTHVHARTRVHVPNSHPKSVFREGYAKLQECRLLPELCQRLGEASSRQGSWKQENYNRQG